MSFASSCIHLQRRAAHWFLVSKSFAMVIYKPWDRENWKTQTARSACLWTVPLEGRSSPWKQQCSWGPEHPALALLLEENTLSSRAVALSEVILPKHFKPRNFAIFSGLIPIAYNYLVSWIRNQTVKLESRFCEVFALPLKYMLEV